MKKDLLYLGMCLLVIILIIPFWVNFNAKLEEKEPITRFIDFLYEIPLEEPNEYLYRYSKEGEYTDLIDIYYMDVSNWDIQKVLSLFHAPKEISGKMNILYDCEMNLRFRNDEELGVLQDLLDGWYTEDCVWVQLERKYDARDKLSMIYNPDLKECILISSNYEN